MQDLLDQFKTASAEYINELESAIKGNKSAGARARKVDMKSLRPLLKEIKVATLVKA